MSQAAELIGLAIAACTLLGLLYAHYKWVRPIYRRVKHDVVGSRDVLLGRPPVTDSITGKEIAPPLLGVGQRVTALEDTLHQLADQRRELDSHHDRITALEDSRLERVVNQVESAEMWRAVNNAHDATTDDAN